MDKKYTIFDLFAGCGGLSQGFLNIKDFEIPIANEFWKPAKETYKKHNLNTKMFEESIIDLTNDKIDLELKNQNIKDIDIIIGGPPCQGFSITGLRNPKDKRNQLFLEFIRIIEHLQPKMFVFENVKGLLSMKDEYGNLIINQIITKFKEMKGNYTIQYKVLNSADYGVPQKRERLILIGSNIKNIENYNFHPIPTHCPKTNLKELKKWFKRNTQINNLSKIKDINNLPFFVNDIIKDLNEWNNIESVLKDLEQKIDITDEFNHKPMIPTEIVRKRMLLIKEGENIPNDQSNWKDELKIKRYGMLYKRLNRNESSCTMTAGHSAIPYHYYLNRHLTVREVARIQTLPDNLKFYGNKTEQYIIVCNAVPPMLATAIAKRIKYLINKDDNNENK